MWSVREDGKTHSRDEIPLQDQVDVEPFDKWGIDFIGPIDPPSGKKSTSLYALVTWQSGLKQTLSKKKKKEKVA